MKYLKISVRPEKHHRGKFFMSKDVFAYFHEMKDVDSRNEKKISKFFFEGPTNALKCIFQGKNFPFRFSAFWCSCGSI